MYNKAIIAEHQLFKKTGQRENVKRKKRIIWMHMSREINLYASRKRFYINSYKDSKKKIMCQYIASIMDWSSDPFSFFIHFNPTNTDE